MSTSFPASFGVSDANILTNCFVIPSKLPLYHTLKTSSLQEITTFFQNLYLRELSMLFFAVTTSEIKDLTIFSKMRVQEKKHTVRFLGKRWIFIRLFIRFLYILDL